MSQESEHELFENAPADELRLLRHLLQRINPALLDDLMLLPACESVPVDDLLPEDWEHVLWLAHARLDAGGVVSGLMHVQRPTMLFKFRLCQTEGNVLTCVPGTILVYHGFDAWQVSRMVEMMLAFPAPVLLEYLGALLRSWRWNRGINMLRGKVLVLGPHEMHDACARVRGRR